MYKEIGNDLKNCNFWLAIIKKITGLAAELSLYVGYVGL